MGISVRNLGQTALNVVRGRQKRIAERISVTHDTFVMRKGTVTYTGRVFDVTPYGFMVQTEANIQPRDLIEISLPGLGWVAAQVRWAGEGGRLGCVFLDPIEAPEFRGCLSNMLG